MRTIKRLLAAGLAVATLVSVPAFAVETDGLEHFQPVAAYSDELFTDLDPNGWYMENVETAYELGLMKGVGSGSFSPNGTISLGETIALAARGTASTKPGRPASPRAVPGTRSTWTTPPKTASSPAAPPPTTAPPPPAASLPPSWPPPCRRRPWSPSTRWTTA